jgi:hypothetical protein
MKKPKSPHKEIDDTEAEPVVVEPQEHVAADIITPMISTSPIPGPIIGVVDGSDAAPGQVGEFLTATGTFAYAAGTTGGVTSTGSINLISMPPGDWDLTISAAFSTLITSALFELNPFPVTGMSNQMIGLNGNFTTGSMVEAVIIGQSARGSFAVTTALVFEVQVYQVGTALLAGTMSLRIEARRRR